MLIIYAAPFQQHRCMSLPIRLEHSSSTYVNTYPSTTFQQTDVTTYPFRTSQLHRCHYITFYNIPAAQMSLPTLLQHSNSTDVTTYLSTTFQQHICHYLPFYNIPAAHMSLHTLLQHSSSTDVSTYTSRTFQQNRCHYLPF
jgi:hypothetical protein